MKLKYEQHEMYKIINALDFYSRIWIGQYDRILYDIRWYRNCKQLDERESLFINKLLHIRHILLPGLVYGWSSSYGIFSDEIDFRAGVAYDMQQEFRNKLAWFNNPEGGITVDFNPVMHCESDPYIVPTARCFEEDGKVYEEINICNEQFEIIKAALEIHECLYNGDIKKLFSYYTDNELALRLAQEVTDLMLEVDIER